MNTKMIRYILCRMLGVEAVLLMIPVIVAALYQEMSGIAFLIPAGILLLLFFLAGVKKPEQSHIYGKEGMVIVALAWILWSAWLPADPVQARQAGHVRPGRIRLYGAGMGGHFPDRRGALYPVRADPQLLRRRV